MSLSAPAVRRPSSRFLMTPKAGRINASGPNRCLPYDDRPAIDCLDRDAVHTAYTLLKRWICRIE